MYRKMYELYKNKMAESAVKKWEEYAINVPADIANDIKKFVPVKR